MPYLPPNEQTRLSPMIATACSELLRQPNPGALNYFITRLCLAYLCDLQNAKYATRAEVIGALECAKLEFARRALADYETRKAKQNGDLY